MPTNEERRRIATMLRAEEYEPWDDVGCEIAQCVGIECCNSECHGSSETPECAEKLNHRLVDLIEPEPERTCHIEWKPPTVKGNWGYGMCSFCGTGVEYGEAPFYCTNCGAKVVEDAD